MLKYLVLEEKQIMVSGVTACLGGVGSVCFLASPRSFWQIPCCFRMLVMPVIVPAACYSWEFGQGNGKRLLPKK